MSLVHYYAPFSTSTLSYLALEELGVPYEKKKVDLAHRDQDPPELAGLNPNRRVPVLVHDGQAIYESAAIVLYLGETFGVERGLFPAPGPQRGVAMQWIVWANVTVAAAVQRYLTAASPRSPKERHNEAVATWSRAELGSLLGILDAELATRPYLLGETYSLVDAHLAGTVGWIASLELLPAGLPHLGAWFGRCTARPAFGRVMAG